MSSASLASPDYIGDLGSGLVRRWSTPADAEKVARCMMTVYRDSADAPLAERVGNEGRICFLPSYPLMGPGDFAVVEDTSLPDRPIVACTCYWRHRWSLGGIPFNVGRPEYVATWAEYRNRGLIRGLFEMVHARSAANGDLVQAITGIEYYYRQFGYEYVLDLDGRRFIYAAAVPAAEEGKPEPFHLRPARVEDAPALHAIYNARRDQSLVWNELSEDDWRYFITIWNEPLVAAQAPEDTGVAMRPYMIEDAAGAVCGFVMTGTKRRSRGFGIYAFEMAAHTNWQAAMPSILRGLCELGRQTPVISADIPPLEELAFVLGRDHPAYAAVGDKLVARSEPVYAWYLRVADIPGFVRHIAAVIEARLARSILAGYSGELKISFYRGGLRLQFEEGKLTAAEPWRVPPYGEADAGCPASIFLQLLFGYRSLAELRAVFPDVEAKEPALLLLDTLFPKQPSHVAALSYT